MGQPQVFGETRAAFLQHLRAALQKHLKGRLSTYGATYARFVYAVPFVAIYVAVLAGPLDMPVPVAGAPFVLYTLVGASAQIIATFLLIHLFSYKNLPIS